MIELLLMMDLIVSILAFFVLAAAIYLYSIVKLQPIAHIKSRLFHRFYEIKKWMSLALSSIFFIWMAATLDFISDSEMPFMLEVVGRFNFIIFEILALSLYPIGRILEGNKRRRIAYYYHTLDRLKRS